MDEDIDIEEHDLLDNPRIKSIFPDLSCVKIEIPDEEEFEEPNEELPDDSELSPEDMGYHYEYSFEQNEDVPETSAGYEETEYYNNQIILGSKPPLDLEDLREEALNSHPTVFLENWDTRLKYSPCFCQTCKILFPTVNALDAHKMISHSYLVALDVPQKNTARKSTVTSKFCNHCSKMFPDDTSLIKHLYELLPLNNFSKAKEEKVEKEVKEHTCQKCKKVFPNIAALKWHDKIGHPTLEVNVQPKKVKITTKLNKIKFDKVKVASKLKVGKDKVSEKVEVKEKTSAFKKMSKEGKFFYSSSLVPKSTLFQCNGCQICFLSCFATIQHSNACGKSIPHKKCSICKRDIRAKDVKMHELQHSFADKLKIYTLNKNIYNKVLCRCPKCLSCLDELGFWAHYKTCKKQEKKCYCSDCDIYIAPNRYESHRGKHAIKKLTKKDFIIIDFHDYSAKSTDRVETLVAKKKRLKDKRRERNLIKKTNEKKIRLYYCESCGCCLCKLQYKGHTKGGCKCAHYKKVCEECGLSFTTKSMESHLLRHKKYSFTLKDIKIFNLFTGAQMEAPMPEFFKCDTCDIHFLYNRLIKFHECDTERHETCKICSKKFCLQAYKVHKIFHPVDTFMPELIEKYKSITNIWSVIYMCSTCELVTMTYDSVVNHCQRHFNSIHSDHRKYCSVCDLQIAESDFASHDLLHRNNASIERASFKILMYDFEDLYKKNWMSVFRPLSKQHRQQILSNSVYRYTRNVKIHVEKSGATHDVNYICMICKSIIDGPDVPEHLKAECDHNAKFHCKICNNTSKTLKNFISHACKKNNSTMVSFNHETDKEFDFKLSVEVSIAEGQSKSDKTKENNPPTAKEMSSKVKKSYIIYKCAKCKVCLNLKKSINRHHCVADSKKTFCSICQQYITSKKIRTHLEAHRKKPSVNKNTLSVVYFNDDEKLAPNSSVNAKIFKCQCGLHFTSLKSIHKHLDICKPDLEISKDVCSKCNLLFPTDALVTHLVNHHSKEVKIDIETISRVNLYKCATCTLLFTTQSLFYEHMENCDPKNGKFCLDCNLKFGKRCFAKHKCSAKGTHVNKMITMKKTIQINTVYQCEPCEICYLSYKSFQYHRYEVKHKNKTTLITCDNCGLRFTSYSYHKHEKCHSVGNFYKIKVINAVSGESNIISGRNVHKNLIAPQKRKLEDTETEVLIKKVKTYPGRSERSRRRSMKFEMPSTSKDASSSHSVKNVRSSSQNIDINDTTVDINETLDDKRDTDVDENDTVISRKLKARISLDNYNNDLYKCIYCNQHFMKEASFDYHIKAYLTHIKTKNYKCEICELDFSKHTLPRHKYIHHKGMGLKREDFVIFTETNYTREHNMFSRRKSNSDANEDNIIFIGHPEESNVNVDTVIRDGESGRNNSESGRNNSESGRNESDIGRNGSENNKTITNVELIEKRHYYKCADCNVCFVDKTMCLQHTLEHNTLDPKLYIQCKICEFQFMIDSLKDHMDIHHSTDYNKEFLTIHEYKPLGRGLEPKLDIYLAVDKVQSRLISTTTDMGVV